MEPPNQGVFCVSTLMENEKIKNFTLYKKTRQTLDSITGLKVFINIQIFLITTLQKILLKCPFSTTELSSSFSASLFL